MVKKKTTKPSSPRLNKKTKLGSKKGANKLIPYRFIFSDIPNGLGNSTSGLYVEAPNPSTALRVAERLAARAGTPHLYKQERFDKESGRYFSLPD